ncbi:MAG: hypothetical protein PW734_00685 [Verrucomicrobium sp.]|nr:hypothetical protein [Verrucomicrobium sp.]
MTWEEILLGKAHGIHGEIGALDHFLRGQAELPPGAEALFAGHYALLDDLYLRQIPFARAAAGCDLLLSYRPAAGAAAPEQAGLAAVDRLFGNVRAQIGAVTRAVLDARPQAGEEEGELSVSAYAPGRFVGFLLPEGDGSPALRQSLHHLGAAARALPQADPAAVLAGEIDDPEARDAALGALKKLFPSRDASIEALELRGRALPLPAEEAARVDRQAVETAGRLMAQPARDSREARFTGDLLQIDYELRRFELRNIDGAPVRGLRCAYAPELAALCEGLAKRRVVVEGAVSLRQGRPRLLHVAAIREA